MRRTIRYASLASTCTLLAIAIGAPLGSPLQAQSQLRAAGVVESSAGGLRFPDGSLQARAAAPYAGIVTVAASGADHISIQDAIDSITGASASNRWLVRVAPGVYPESIAMASFVDVEGAGRLATVIAGGTATDSVACANESELRQLAVSAESGAAIACAGASPRLSDLAVRIAGSACAGIANTGGASPRIRDVEIDEASSCDGATGLVSVGGQQNVDGLAVTMTGAGNRFGIFDNVTAGSYYRDVEVAIEGAATAYGINASSTFDPVLERVSVRILALVDGYGLLLANSGQPLLSEVVSAVEANNAYGLRIVASSPTIGRSRFFGDGAATGFGIQAVSATVRINAVEAEAGGSVTRALVLQSSSLEARDAGLVAIDPNGIGLLATATSGSFTARIDDSVIRSAGPTIVGDAEFSTFVGGTRLDGGAVNAAGGSIVCAGVWSEAYAFSASLCP
jgi:hypothetical protein